MNSNIAAALKSPGDFCLYTDTPGYEKIVFMDQSMNIIESYVDKKPPTLSDALTDVKRAILASPVGIFIHRILSACRLTN